MISCIMPVKPGHEHFLPGAIACWRAQQGVTTELLVGSVIAGSPKWESRLWPPGVRVFETHGPLGAQRNQLCERARGEYIAHWDVDDWSAPHRLASTLARLNLETCIAGLRAMLFHDLRTDEVWRFHDRGPVVNLGTSLIYEREWWARHRFPETGREAHCGEDKPIVRRAKALGLCDLFVDDTLMVARSHAGNTSERNYAAGTNNEWQRASWANLPEGYRLLASTREGVLIQ